MGILFAVNSYWISGRNSLTVIIVPIAEMVLVAVFEELVFRGLLFRIIEKSLGSWRAQMLSSVIFAVAHLPNQGVTVLAVAMTAGCRGDAGLSLYGYRTSVASHWHSLCLELPASRPCGKARWHNFPSSAGPCRYAPELVAKLSRSDICVGCKKSIPQETNIRFASPQKVVTFFQRLSNERYSL